MQNSTLSNLAKKNFLTQIITTNQKIRSSNLLLELEKQAIDYHLSNGFVVEKNNYDSGKLVHQKITKLLCQRNLTMGEIGCAIAHKITAKNLLNSKFNFGLTFEDDAEILDEIDFEALQNQLNSEFPIVINLGWIPGYAVAFEKSKQVNLNLTQLVTPPTCAFAYAFNRVAAKLISEDFKKIIDLADWPVNLLNLTQFFVVNTPWASAPQSPDLSIIGVRTQFSNSGRIYKIARKLKYLFSLIALFFAFNFSTIKVSNKQLIHRMVLRDLIYSYGNEKITELLTIDKKNGIIFINKKMTKILGLFGVKA